MSSIRKRTLLIIACLVSVSLPFAISAPPKSSTKSPSASLGPLIELLADVDDPAFQLDVLNGIHKAINGRRNVKMPAEWPKVAQALAKSSDTGVRSRALEIGVIFGDPRAFRTLRDVAADPKRKSEERKTALRSLVQYRDSKTLPILNRLLTKGDLRSAAIRSLAAYDDASTPARLIALYGRLNDSEKRDARATLAARPKYALALLDAIEKKTIPSRDVSAFLIRQMSTFNDRSINERIAKVWGSVRAPKKDRARLIARYKKTLTPKSIAGANRARGRVLFRKTCAACHRLFDDGKRIGPELTGSQRTNLDYLLENLLDPNALIGRDYRMTVIATKNGRLMTGIVKENSAKTLTLQTANDTLIVAKTDIEVQKQSTVSLMPEGQIEKLSKAELRDLIGYLMGSGQVPLPDSSDTR